MYKHTYYYHTMYTKNLNGKIAVIGRSDILEKRDSGEREKLEKLVRLGVHDGGLRWHL